jgi:hypothetical protein
LYHRREIFGVNVHNQVYRCPLGHSQ